MKFGFGSGVLTGVSTTALTPQRFGALQDVAVEFGGDTKELYSMNQFPIDTARGKVKITGKAKVAQIKGAMYNDLYFGQTLATGQTKYAFNESATLGTGAASYTVVNSGSTPLVDQGVFFASNGNQLSAVSSAPGSGQYTFTPSTGVYAFSTHSASLGMVFNYLYKVTSGFNIAGGNPFMGVTPRFRADLMLSAPHSTTDQTVLTLYACVAGRLSFPTRIDDYTIQDLDFSAFADETDKVFNWSSTE